MKKRVFIVHGWEGHPKEILLLWLKKELEQKRFHVQTPEMPETDEPKIEAWVSRLVKVVGDVDEDTFFVGHSIGCQAILRYLEKLPTGKKIGGAVFVAGWFTLTNLETREEEETAKPWIEIPIDFEKVKRHTKKFFAVFSDDDEFVPLENKEMFEQRLGARTVVLRGKGHFIEGDGVKELPIVRDKLFSWVGK